MIFYEDYGTTRTSSSGVAAPIMSAPTTSMTNTNIVVTLKNVSMPPPVYFKTFYLTEKHANQGVVPFFEEIGYRRVGDWKSSHVHILWRLYARDVDKYLPMLFNSHRNGLVEKWERLGYIPNSDLYNDKGDNIKYMKLHSKATCKSIDYIPSTFRLYDFVILSILTTSISYR